MNRKIDKIIIHVSDSPDDRDIGVEEINLWHKERDFTPYNGSIYCGYNYVIRRNGVLENPRPDDVAGIHCSNHNAHSIGICWVGQKVISLEQIQTLLELCARLIKTHSLTTKEVFGHHEFNQGKTCPNIIMDEFRDTLDEYSQSIGG